jgi:hypothetical protein
MVLKRLDILNFNKEDIARLGCLDLEWARQIMDLGQIDILHVIILDRSAEGD